MPEILPKINDTLAIKTLDEIDAILYRSKELVNELEGSFVKLSSLLLEAKRGQYYSLKGYTSEEEYIKEIFPQSRTTYYALISIGENLGQYPKKLLEAIGRTKCESLVRVKKHSGEVPEEWFKHAMEDDRKTFRRRVKSYLGEEDNTKKLGNPHQEDYFMTFRIFGDAISVVKRTFDTVSRMSGSDKSLGHQLELLCANFLSQFDDDGRGNIQGNNSLALMTIRGLIQQLDLNKKGTIDELINVVREAVEKNQVTE